MGSRHGWVLLVGLLVGCRATTASRVEETRPEPPVVAKATPVETEPPGARAREQSWEGTIRVSEDHGSNRKVFNGVWLEAPDGQRRVLTYEKDSPFHALCDQPVRVTGELYTPPGQALVAEHLRSHELRATADRATFKAIGDRRTLRGHFVQLTPGAREALFVESGGRSHHVSHIAGQTGTPVPRCSRGAPLVEPGGIPLKQEIEIEAYPVSNEGAVAEDASVWVMSWKPLKP